MYHKITSLSSREKGTQLLLYPFSWIQGSTVLQQPVRWTSKANRKATHYSIHLGSTLKPLEMPKRMINDQMSPSNLTWFTLFKNPTLAVYHAKLLATGWNPNWVVDHDNSNMSWAVASLRVPQVNSLKWTCNKQGISWETVNHLLGPGGITT